jgi:hypothetical protein
MTFYIGERKVMDGRKKLVAGHFLISCAGHSTGLESLWNGSGATWSTVLAADKTVLSVEAVASGLSVGLKLSGIHSHAAIELKKVGLAGLLAPSYSWCSDVWGSGPGYAPRSNAL